MVLIVIDNVAVKPYHYSIILFISVSMCVLTPFVLMMVIIATTGQASRDERLAHGLSARFSNKPQSDWYYEYKYIT